MTGGLRLTFAIIQGFRQVADDFDPDSLFELVPPEPLSLPLPELVDESEDFFDEEESEELSLPALESAEAAFL